LIELRRGAEARFAQSPDDISRIDEPASRSTIQHPERAGYRQTKVLRCCPTPRFIQKDKDKVRFHFDGETDSFLLARIQTGQDGGVMSRVYRRRPPQPPLGLNISPI
jgi:hypothetical protein